MKFHGYFSIFLCKNVDIFKLESASKLNNFWLNKVVFGSNQRVKIVIFNGGNLDGGVKMDF